MPRSAGFGSAPAPSGERSRCSVSASQGPAVTRDQSATATSLTASSTAAPASMRMAAAKLRPSRSASCSASRNCRIERSRRSRSISTHWPRSSTSESVPDSSAAISFALSVSPSSVTSMWKSSTPSSPSAEGLRAPTVPVTCGRGGRLARHDGGMRTTTPARSRSGTLASRREASRGVQRSGWYSSPAIEHGPEPVAGLGGALHRQQQRQQLLAIGRAGVFAQRLAERHVLRARLGGKLRRVGGEEGKRRIGVAAVLRQVEVHAPDQVPGRVQTLEEALQVGFCRGKRRRQCRGDLLPQRAQHVRRQVFRPRHHRRRQHQGRKLGVGRCRYFRGWLQAQARPRSASQIRATTGRAAAVPAPLHRRRAAAIPRRCHARTHRPAARRRARPIPARRRQSSKTRCACGVRRRLGCGMRDVLAIGRPRSRPCCHRNSPLRTVPQDTPCCAKQETLWGSVEGRLLAMLEGVDDRRLALRLKTVTHISSGRWIYSYPVTSGGKWCPRLDRA